MANNNNNTDSNYFSKKITLLNVLLTFSIVILHAKTPERWGLVLDRNFPFIYWTHAVVQIGVPCFFFISGMLFYRNCRDFSTIERKLISRIHSLLFPYLIWNTIFVAIFFLMTHIAYIHARMNMGDALNSPFEILTAIIFSKFTVLWFVEDLMIFCSLSALIFIILKNLQYAVVILIITILAVIIYRPEYESIFYWLPMYLSGAIMGRYIIEDNENHYRCIRSIIGKKRSLLLGSFLITALILLICLSGFKTEEYLFWYRLLSPVFLWFIIDIFFSKTIIRNFKRRNWMTYMFFIFCSHQFLLNILQKFVVLTLPPTDFILNTTFVISPVIVVLILISIAKFLSGYQIFKYLNGGR